MYSVMYLFFMELCLRDLRELSILVQIGSPDTLFYCCIVCDCSGAQLCPVLWHTHQASLSGILQARILAWVAISSSRRSSWPGDRTCICCFSWIGRWILYHWASWEVFVVIRKCKSLSGQSVLYVNTPLISFEVAYGVVNTAALCMFMQCGRIGVCVWSWWIRWGAYSVLRSLLVKGLPGHAVPCASLPAAVGEHLSLPHPWSLDIVSMLHFPSQCLISLIAWWGWTLHHIL